MVVGEDVIVAARRAAQRVQPDDLVDWDDVAMADGVAADAVAADWLVVEHDGHAQPPTRPRSPTGTTTAASPSATDLPRPVTADAPSPASLPHVGHNAVKLVVNTDEHFFAIVHEGARREAAETSRAVMDMTVAAAAPIAMAVHRGLEADAVLEAASMADAARCKAAWGTEGAADRHSLADAKAAASSAQDEMHRRLALRPKPAVVVCRRR